MLFGLGGKRRFGINQRLARWITYHLCTNVFIRSASAFDLDIVFYPQSKQMIRTWKARVTHLTRIFLSEMLPWCPFFHSWLTLAPACLNILSFPEYHADMWESLRKYLSRADTASHFCPLSSPRAEKLWNSIEIFLKETVRRAGNCLLINKELSAQLWKRKQSHIFRSISQIRSVTVCSACLWI